MRHVAQYPDTLAAESSPKIEISPCVGCASPASARKSVVFPAPLSPRIAWNLPASNSAVTPRSAAKRPNCLITLLTVMTGMGGLATGVE